jgi:esterase/lipase superfamily enzyme
VGTTRTPIPGTADFGSGRARDMSFASYTVSVPPTHAIGQVEWPDENADPAQDFVMAAHRDLADSGAFLDAVQGRVRTLPAGTREAVIFVHGYNTNMAEGLYRFAQMQHDFDTGAIPILYSWPSAANAADYIYDRDSILFARSGLEDLIDTLADASIERIVLVGHSMGGQLVMEVLRQRVIRKGNLWPKMEMVTLISPDLDIDVFHAQTRDIGPLPQPFVVFTSGSDSALRLSEWLSGSSEKLGAAENLDRLAALDVTVIDTTAIKGAGVDDHLAAVTSPWMISVLKGLRDKGAFALDPRRPIGLLPVRIVVDTGAGGFVLRRR